MKKRRLLLPLVVAALLCVGFPVFAAEPIQVVLDGSPLAFDVPPANIGGRAMVPMRVIFEALGASVEWDSASNTVTAIKEDTVVRASIGSAYIDVNGSSSTMDVAPLIWDGRTLVPVRFISEAFGCDVRWDGDTSTVYIDNSGDSLVHGIEIPVYSASPYLEEEIGETEPDEQFE